MPLASDRNPQTRGYGGLRVNRRLISREVSCIVSGSLRRATDEGLALAYPVVRGFAAPWRVTTDPDPVPENSPMTAVLLVTCWICWRLHSPVHPLALNPICANCASKPIPQTTTSPASG